MIPYLSEKITSSFIRNEIIADKDYEVYIYSFEILLSTLLNFVAMCVIAITTKTVSETLVYLLAFIPLRQLVGGYHARNHIRCFLLLIMSYMGFLLIINFLSVNYGSYVIIVSILISNILVFLLAPIADANKPLTNEEIKGFKVKSRIAIIIYSISTILITILSLISVWGLAFALGILSVSLSLIAGKIKNVMEDRSLLHSKNL